MYQNKITRKINLESNDGLSIYDNTMAAQQHENSFQVFYDFIKEIKPARILEIGTALGGFTRFLSLIRDQNSLNYDILSYDIFDRADYNEIRSLGVDLRVENVFNDSYTEVSQSVVSFIQSPGLTLVLCDGGNKIGEFNLLSKFLKSSDFIMAHDYSVDSNFFNDHVNLKIWNWHEIQYSDIEASFKSNNLSLFMNEVFSNIAWVCSRKG